MAWSTEVADATSEVAFIGLGNMGGPMALNVVRAGHPTSVFDLDADKIAPLVEAGALPATDAAAAVRGARTILTSLPGPRQVEAISDVILDNSAPGTVWADLSTSDSTTASAIAS